MRLRSASIRDFRNLETAELVFSPQFTCFLGPNGQGKTNTIEALYLVAALRPLRNVPRKALIRAGAPESEIRLDVSHAKTGLEHELGVRLRGSSRVLEKDGKRCDTGQFLGHAVAIAFTPDDLLLAKGGPDARRRFLDRALLNVRPAYLQSALRYQKAIRDRNRLLADDAPDATLEAFDVVVAQEGAAITQARASYAEQIVTAVGDWFRDIADPAPVLAIRYQSQLLASAKGQNLVEAFMSALAERR